MSAQRRAWECAAAGLTFSALVVAGGNPAWANAPAAAKDTSLVRVSAADNGRSVLVVTPPGRNRTASDFKVTVDGVIQQVVVQRKPSARLVVVVDTSLPAGDLSAAIGAARELLILTPAASQVAIVDAAVPAVDPPTFVARERALSELVGLRGRAARPVFAGWITALARSAPDSGLSAVFFGDAGAPSSAGAADVATLKRFGVTVSAAVLGRPAQGYLGDAPSVTAGRLTSVATPGAFVAAADAAAADMANTYQLSLGSTVSSGSISVQVRGVDDVVTGLPDATATGSGQRARPAGAPLTRTPFYQTAWPYLAGLVVSGGAATLLLAGRRRDASSRKLGLDQTVTNP